MRAWSSPWALASCSSLITAANTRRLSSVSFENPYEVCGLFADISASVPAKCVDTFISLSAAQRPAAGDPSANLNTSFSASGEGATSTSASLTSPITPFSKSALPSKSLLSRQEVPGVDAAHPGGEDASVQHAETPLVLKRGVQGQLQTVIERLFEECFRQKRYRQVIGIAIEAKSLEVLRMAILRASEDEKKQSGESHSSEELMEYVLDICMGIVQERAFRNEVCSDTVSMHGRRLANIYFYLDSEADPRAP